MEQDAHETMEEDSETIEVNNSKEASHSIVKCVTLHHFLFVLHSADAAIKK